MLSSNIFFLNERKLHTYYNFGMYAFIFGLCYAMVPFYKLFCEHVGISGNFEKKDYSMKDKACKYLLNNVLYFFCFSHFLRDVVSHLTSINFIIVANGILIAFLYIFCFFFFSPSPTTVHIHKKYKVVFKAEADPEVNWEFEPV